MTVAVKLIVCTNNKSWHHHWEFSDNSNGISMEEIEKKAVDNFIKRTKGRGDLRPFYNRLDINFVGVEDSKIVK